MSNNKSNDDNLLREVIGDYKNDKKTQKNLNEEGENDEYAELYRTVGVLTLDKVVKTI